MDLTIIRVKTDGLYADGIGMSSLKARVWDDYWMLKFYSNSWKVVKRLSAIYLAHVNGGGMIHPEGFRIPVLEPIRRLGPEMADLDVHFNHLARTLGFTYTITAHEMQDVDAHIHESYSLSGPGRRQRKEHT